MESDAQKTLKQVFCTQLLEFMDDILRVFPNNLDLKTGKTFIIGLTKVSKKKTNWNMENKCSRHLRRSNYEWR